METQVTTVESQGTAAAVKDVFVSYSHKDGAWVQDYLARLLDAAGITYEIDVRDFELGRSSAQNMRDAVAKCKHTLVVLTPDWVASDWTNFEADLALAKDPDGTKRSLIVVMLKECQVPAAFRERTYLDVREFDDRDDQMARLLSELGAQDYQVDQARAVVAEKTLHALAELMAQPEVERVVTSFRPTFERIQELLNAVDMNKKIHDCLHVVEIPIERLYQLAGQFTDEESDAWRDADYQVRLIQCQQPVAEALMERRAGDSISASWLKSLCEAFEMLADAVEEREPHQTRFSGELLYKLLRQHMPRLNARIVEKVNEIPLSDLAKSVESIRERLKKYDFDAEAAARFEQFREGIAPLFEVTRAVETLVRRHDLLQEVDNHVGGVDLNDTLQLKRIEFSWKMLSISVLRDDEGKSDLGRLPGDKLQQRAEAVADLLHSTEEIRNEAFEAQVVRSFSRFRDAVKRAFQTTDIDICCMCDDLSKWIENIESIVERMREHVES
jgi:hypothetical protein